MLFPPESIVKARRALFAQMEAGTLTREQAFQQALELDPFDVVALVILAEDRFKAGDLAGGVEYCWRAVSADPCRFEAWFKLTGCLPGESQDLRNGIMELGARKALRDPEGLDQFKETFKKKPIAADFTDGEEFLEITAETFGEQRRDEPEEVSERLRPYRLIDDLLETAEDGLDQELVDGILEDGARCLPLLIGVLRAMATGSLPGGDPSPIVSSLALLGEIGDPAVLPEIIECYTVDDEGIQAAAHWALNRIASRQPEASFAAIRELALASDDAGDRSIISMALGGIPDQPGKRDILLGLLDGLSNFPRRERYELFMAVALALDFSEGSKGRELAWSLFSRHAAVLPKRTRAQLREAFQVHDEMDRIAPVPGDAPKATVYDLCSRGYDEDEADEEDGEDEEDYEDEEDEDDEDYVPEPVRRAVTLGRNDPCWCGSGKKYKKCHLESDEKSQPAQAGPKQTPRP